MREGGEGVEEKGGGREEGRDISSIDVANKFYLTKIICSLSPQMI